MTDFDDINESMDQYINKLLLNISPEMHMQVNYPMGRKAGLENKL